VTSEPYRTAGIQRNSPCFRLSQAAEHISTSFFFSSFYLNDMVPSRINGMCLRRDPGEYVFETMSFEKSCQKPCPSPRANHFTLGSHCQHNTLHSDKLLVYRYISVETGLMSIIACAPGNSNSRPRLHLTRHTGIKAQSSPQDRRLSSLNSTTTVYEHIGSTRSRLRHDI
jgi:hypothetical protein